MATVACKCGEKFHPSPEHYGKEVRCRKCGRTVKLIPDPSLDAPPPPPKRAPFSQTFGDSTPKSYSYSPPPTYSYSPPPAPSQPGQQPTDDPNRPPGLHPEIRRILIYAALLCAAISVALIVRAFKQSPPPAQEAPAEG
jgi:hypothetical protein